MLVGKRLAARPIYVENLAQELLLLTVTVSEWVSAGRKNKQRNELKMNRFEL